MDTRQVFLLTVSLLTPFAMCLWVVKYQHSQRPGTIELRKSTTEKPLPTMIHDSSSNNTTTLKPLPTTKNDSNSNKTARKSFSWCELGMDTPLYRIPTNVIPLHYDVHIRPILDNDDPDQFTAPGKITITVSCLQRTKSITLHSLVTSINETSVQVTDMFTGIAIKKAQPGKINSTDETYTITLKKFLQVNKTYKIYMEFTASVSEGTEGLYRSSYYPKEDSDILRYIATTHFEKTAARRAFPCFDEPALKATFKFHIGFNYRAGYNAMSNMNIVDTRRVADLPGWWWNEFATTVNMSTYLSAFIVSDFKYQEAPEGLYRKRVKIWGSESILKNKNEGYGAITAAKSLAFFEQYLNQTYDLPKMDLVGVPDFATTFRAMENWGLMTFREDLLFFMKNVTMESKRLEITMVVTHEVAHQWLGNLITMTWWNDLWLKEGLTVFAANLATNHTNPEFDSLNTQAITQMQTAMECDAGASTIPLSSYKFHTFGIVYLKGGSIVRMIQGFLGEMTFLKGLRNYFSDRKYANAIQDDLFRNLNKAAQEDGVLPTGLSVKEITDSWTLQTGFPLIRVTKLNKSRMSISQERYKHVVYETSMNANEYWWVPITYTTRSTPILNDYKPKLWLNKTTLIKNLTVSETDLDNDWILLNPDTRSYYRVLYDDALTALIKNQLENDHTVFTSASRSQILDDYFTAAYDGYIPIETALGLTAYIGNEDTLIVWTPVLKHLRKAYLLFRPRAFNFLVKYLGPRLNTTLHLIGPKQSVGEKGVVVTLRDELLEWACEMRLEVCKNYALELYDEWMANPDKNPDIRDTMVCAAGMAKGNDSNLIRNFPLSIGYLFKAMSCHSDIESLERWLSVSFSMDNSERAKYEAAFFLESVAFHSRRNDVALSFLEREFSKNFAYVEDGSGLVETLFSTFASHFYTDEIIQRMEKIISSHSNELTSVRDELMSHIQTVKDNSRWMKVFGRDMINFFKNHQ